MRTAGKAVSYKVKVINFCFCFVESFCERVCQLMPCLTHFLTLILFMYPMNASKSQRFPNIFWGIERDQWHEMG